MMSQYRTFWTKSGSIYEVDTVKQRIRKVSGEPTPRQVNNDWQRFEALLAELGETAAIVWRKPDANGVVPGTETSPVTRIIEGLLS